MSSASSPSPTPQAIDRLTALPPELFERIAEFASPSRNSLHSLRITCREANDKSLRTFSNKFESIAILPCYQPSVMVAQTIAEHKLFGPKIREVAIIVDQRSSYAIKRRPAASGNPATLVEVFKVLRKHGALDSIEFIEYEHNFFAGPVCGLHLMAKSDLEPYALPEDNSAFNTTLKALHRSNLTVENMVVNSSKFWALPSHFHFFLPPSVLKHLFRHLKHLDITLWCGLGRFEQSQAHGLARCFGNATQLETLYVRNIQQDDAIHVRRFSRSLNQVDEESFLEELLEQDLPQLKVLKVNGGCVELKRMVEFVRRHDLEKLDLKFVDVFGLQSEDDDGEEVEDTLRRLTGLKKIDAYCECEWAD